jgi:hypothetical protein
LDADTGAFGISMAVGDQHGFTETISAVNRPLPAPAPAMTDTGAGASPRGGSGAAAATAAAAAAAAVAETEAALAGFSRATGLSAAGAASDLADVFGAKAAAAHELRSEERDLALAGSGMVA